LELLARIRPSLNNTLLPIAAVFMDDLRLALRHWAVVVWLVLGCVLPWVVSTADNSPLSLTAAMQPSASAGASGERGAMTASMFGGALLRWHFLWWTTMVIMVAATAIPAEADFAADAILCRGIARWQYYLGKCAARIVVVVGVYVVLTVGPLGISVFQHVNDLTLTGLLRAVWLGVAFFASIAAIAVAGSIWFRNPTLAGAVVWMFAYGVGIVTTLLEIEALSPVLLVERFGDVLRAAPGNSATPLIVVTAAGATAASVLGVVCYSRRDA
jgi:hypothetical protein